MGILFFQPCDFEEWTSDEANVECKQTAIASNQTAITFRSQWLLSEVMLPSISGNLGSTWVTVSHEPKPIIEKPGLRVRFIMLERSLQFHFFVRSDLVEEPLPD